MRDEGRPLNPAPDLPVSPSLSGNPPRAALEQRIAALFKALRHAGHAFDTALIIDRVNQYYFTGTMQDGILVLRHDGATHFFVRKSVTRAKIESPLDIVEPMAGYRDMLRLLPADLGSTFIETELMPFAMLERLRKYFTMTAIHPLDSVVARIRSIKSDFELGLMREAGRLHNRVLRDILPGLLREGINEADLAADLFDAMIRLGHHGVARFAMFQMEMLIGQVCFGESAIYPNLFNGPGGNRGLSAAVPTLGSRERRLRKGDLVFADTAFGVGGYHTDKTQVFSFGAPPPDEAVAAQRACYDVLQRTCGRLVPGAIPAGIYHDIMADLPPVLHGRFMGFGRECVPFLGHSIGLQVDETPVIASGFTAPIQAGMAFAIEPKCGLAGIGMVGHEETYVVTPNGPECLTGGAGDIMVV